MRLHTVPSPLPVLAALLGAAWGWPQAAAVPAPAGETLGHVGTSVTPHFFSPDMRWRRAPDPELSARVQLFLQNTSGEPMTLTADHPVRLGGRSPDELLAAGDWAWHDFPSAWTNVSLLLPPGALTVWEFNGRRSAWGIGSRHGFQIGTRVTNLAIDRPTAWISAVTFLGDSFQPTRAVGHIANESAGSLRLDRARLWLPASGAQWRVFRPGPWLEKAERWPADGRIPARDQGVLVAEVGPLPLSYAVLEVVVTPEGGAPGSLWAKLRVKREVFDISGGWVASNVGGRNTLTREPFLRTLKRLHLNTGHIGSVAGYTDNAQLYATYPLKLFNRLQPLEQFDTEAQLPRIHAVEFLGEPQYGGGRPVPPMEVWRQLAPYQPTRLATTVTHSEEHLWRFYAGLSDYPHYDAYRVTAPAADAWSLYDRWEGQKIRWGAPLETIGAMSRTLRELNRPMPVAYWSQGAHAGWERYGGRERTSPTPAELRSQAYHALAARITSLYWFNLSLKSLVKFRDLIDPITRVNREIRMIDDLLLEGDAFDYQRTQREGRPDWDLSSVTGPRGGLFFALDLDYRADPEAKVFRFGAPREATFGFRLPAYLARPAEVFRLDADGVHDVGHELRPGQLEIRDRAALVSLYVASREPGLRRRLALRHREQVAAEQAVGFDPAGSDADFEALRALLNP